MLINIEPSIRFIVGQTLEEHLSSFNLQFSEDDLLTEITLSAEMVKKFTINVSGKG
ncbi:MAG: hypothetical protein GY787_30865 [Alteromonadales bacterium]|nr:hypothetical protein [Alteromonadales bacterium]